MKMASNVVTATVPSRRHPITLKATDVETPKGIIIHGNPTRPPRSHPQLPKQLELTSIPSPPDSQPSSSDRRRREAELQRQQRAPHLMQKPEGVAADAPQCVVPRPSVNLSSKSQPFSTILNGNKAKNDVLDVLGSSAETSTRESSNARPSHSMTRAAQEKMRMREIERLNRLEEEKAQTRKVSNEGEIAAAAADARKQLGQASYVALAAQKASAEAQYGAAHQYTSLVKDLHQRLGILPTSDEQTQPKQKKSAKSNSGNISGPRLRRRFSLPANVVADVADKVLALRRAEMAEMVARLRRLLAEGNVTSSMDEIPIIPAAGVVGATCALCPACDFCIELSSEETILSYFVPVMKALTSERVVMPMATRRGSASMTSSGASDNAVTLDSFRVHSSRKLKHAVVNGECEDAADSAQQQPHQFEVSKPSHYAFPRCFRIELVPFGLTRVSIHVSVHAHLAEHFFKAHAQRQERLFSLALDPPYPAKWTEWTAAHRARLLYRVLEDLLHGGPNPPAPAITEDISLFPTHVDAMRDALWTSVWKSRSLAQLLSMPEDAIANYFGPEVMFYYAWMNHYARWLLGAGVLGVVVSLLSSVQLVDPLVLSGAYTKPDSAFTAYHFSIRRHLQHGLDAALLPLFIAVMIIGSVLCIKTWERQCSFLTMRYHLFQQEGKDELRRDFHGTPGRNPVTGEPQLVYPAWYRAVVLQPLAWAIVFFFMAFTIGVMVCSLNLDGMVNDPSSYLAIPCLRKFTMNGGVLDPTVHPYTAMLPRIGYSICVSVLSSLFTKMAIALTRMENYRYRGEYGRALTLKLVAFEFVNSYAKLLFIAFGRVSMTELASNLQSILYVTVLSRLVTGTVLPFFVTHRQRVARCLLKHHEEEQKKRAKEEGGKESADKRSQSFPAFTTMRLSSVSGSHGGDDASAVDEVDEMLDPYDIYADFVEMVIQFGYILLFAAAYPLASFVAVVSNIVEVRSDLFKMCYVVRRPVPRLGLQENATWCGILRVFAMAAVITNTFLLAFTSHQMARWFPDYFTTNGTGTALSYGSMNALGCSDEAAMVAASMASLANSAARRNVTIEVLPGKGRVVMFYSMLMEHVTGLVAAFLLWRIPSTPRAVRHYKGRRLYERMSHS